MKKIIDFIHNWREIENSRVPRKVELFTAASVTVLLILCLIYRLWMDINGEWNNQFAYEGFHVADLMINYEGGFVRRGLLGELLYWLFMIHPFTLHKGVYLLELLFLAAISILTFIVCRRMKWYPILPLALVLNFILYRRDFLMLLMAFAVFDLLFRYVTEEKTKHLVYAIILMVLALILYEPAFFYIVPLSMLIYWTSLKEGLFGKVKKCCKVFAIPIAVMAIITLAGRGSVEIEERIWESWQPMFEHIDPKYKPAEIPGGINFLGRSTRMVMETHWYRNFHLDQADSALFISGSLLMMLCVWFLIVNIPGCYERKDKTMLSSVALLLFVCHIPMLTVLSCDLGRTMYSIIFPALFVVYLSNRYQYEIDVPLASRLCRRLNDTVNRIPVVNTIWFYLFVLLMTPFAFCCGISIESHLYIEFQNLYNSMILTFSQF